MNRFFRLGGGNRRKDLFGQPFRRPVIVLRDDEFADNRMVPGGVVLVTIFFDWFQPAVFSGLEEALVMEILILMSLCLIKIDQIAEKLLFLFVKIEADQKLPEALFGEVPVAVHDKLEEIGGLKAGPFGEGAKGEGGTGIFDLPIPVPQELAVVEVVKKIEARTPCSHGAL